MQPDELAKHRRRVLLRSIVPLAVVMLVLLVLAWLRFVQNPQQPGLANQAQPVNEISLEELQSLPPNASLKINNANQLVINGELKANQAFVVAPGVEPTSAQAGQLYYDQDTNLFRYYDGEQFVDLVFQTDEQEICYVGEECGFLTAADLPSGLTLPQPLDVTDSPTFANITITNDVGVSSGGTGRSTLTNNALLIGNGSDDLDVTNAPSAGQILVANAAGVPTFVGMSGLVSINSSGVTQLADTGVTPGIYGDAGNYPVVTVDADGRITAVSTQPSGGGGAVTALNTLTGALNLNGTANQVVVNDNGTDTITLSLPQAIAVASSPSFAGLNLSANLIVNGSTTLGDALADTLTINGTLQGGSPLSFEGAAADGSELTLDIAALSGDQTITLPDASGTVCLTSGNCVGAGGGAAPSTAQYLALALDGNLSAERVFTAGDGLSSTDGGANGNLTLDIDVDGVTIDFNGSDEIYVPDDAITTNQIAGLTIIGGDIANDTIALGGKTTGNYVATISNGSGISGSSATEGGTPTISLGPLTADWSQTGAFDVVLNNASSELRILESSGGTFYATFDVGDLANDSTISIPGAVGATDTFCLLTLANCAGTAQNLFETINAPNGTDPVADSSTDTLNLTDGTNIIITGTAGTDTIDIAVISNPTFSGLVTLNGNATLQSGDTLTIAGDAFDDLTGNGLSITSGDLALGPLTANWDQTGAFDLILNNASSELSILESSGATFLGTLDVGDLGANRTYTFPDATGDVCLSSGNCLGGGGGAAPSSAQYITLALDGNLSAERVLTNGSGLSLLDGGANGNATLSLGALTAAWNQTGAFDIDLNNASSELRILESAGATFFGALDVTDLTADRTYTFPDSDGTVCLTSGNCVGGGGGSAPNDATYVTLSFNANLSAERVLTSGNGVSFSDGGANGNATLNLAPLTAAWNQTGAFDIDLNNASSELRILESAGATFFGSLDVGDLSADRTYTLPDVDGGLSVLGQTIEGSEITNDTVVLTTDTAGNYVATISNGSGISGSSASEGGTPTISLGPLTADWSQTGAFDVVLNNASSELRILESSGGTFYATFDVGDLANDSTISIPGAVGATDTFCLLTLANCAGTAQNLFETINAPNGTDPVADSSTDTLNLTDGTNIIITGTAGTDTIDIAVISNPTFSGLVTLNGNATLQNGDTLTINGDAFDDLTGNGLSITSGDLALGPLTANWDQTGAFDLILNNAGSELSILESSGATFYATFDVGDLANDSTISIPGAVGATDTFCLLTLGNCAGGSNIWTDGGTFTYTTNGEDVVLGGTSTAAADIWLQATGAAVFNEQGNDADFRIEGDNEQNLFVADASLDSIGIGVSGGSSTTRLLVIRDTAGTSADSNIAIQSRAWDTGVVSSGTDSNTGQLITVIRTGATGGTILNTGLEIDVNGDTGGNSTNTGILVDVSGADINYAAIFTGGDVGIGDVTPDAKLDVQGTATGTVVGILQAVASQAADILQVLDSSGNELLAVEADGDAVFGHSSLAGELRIADGTSHFASVISGNQTANRNITIPITSGDDTFCLVTLANCSGGTLQAAYDLGNTITTTNARDISITLADTVADANLIVNLAGQGDFIIQDAGTAAFTLNDDGTAVFTTSQSTGNTFGVNLNFTQADDADATDQMSALRLNVTSSSGDADTLQGISVEGIVAGAATERAISIGSGWDSQLYFNDTSTIIQVVDTGDITFEDASGNDMLVLRDVNNLVGNAGVLTQSATVAAGYLQRLDLTLGDDADTDTVAGIALNITSAATGDADTLQGINIASLSGPDATVVERAISIGSGWDAQLYFGDTSTNIQVQDNGQVVFEDASGNDIVRFRDVDSLTSANGALEQQLTTASGSAQYISLTLGDDADVDPVSGILLDVNSAATGDADTLHGINIANLSSANATVIERAISIGANWDAQIYFSDSTTLLQIANGGVITFEDDSGNDLFVLSDSTGNLTTTNDHTIQGGDLTLGGNSQQGSLAMFDGGTGAASHSATVRVNSALANNTTVEIPAAVGATDTFCLLTLANCIGGSNIWTDGGTFAYTTNSEDVVLGGTSTATADIWLLTTGAAVFNEQSNDADFRIEGDNEANLLFVDAGVDRIGIGDSTPDSRLDIEQTITGSGTYDFVSMVLTNNTSSSTQQLAVLQNATGSGSTERLLVLENADTDTVVQEGILITSAAGGINVGINVADADLLQAIDVGSNTIAGTNPDIDFANFDLTTAGSGRFSSTLDVQGAAIQIGTTSQAGMLTLNDGSSDTVNITLAAQSTARNATIPNLTGGNDTFCMLVLNNCSGVSNWTDTGTLLHPADLSGDEDIVIGGTTAGGADIFLQGNGAAAGSVVFNEQGNNADFRVEGDNEANLIVADASADAVGIGDATPDARFDVQGASTSTVVGIIQGVGSQSADIFQVLDSSSNELLTVEADGDVAFNANLLPNAAGTQDIGSTALEIDQVYLADNGGLVLGLDQDAELGYDEAGEDRVELTGTGAGLFIEDKLSLGTQALTTISGAGTDTPTVTASYLAITVSDDNDAVSIAETGAQDGDVLFIINVDATAADSVIINDIDGQVELAGSANQTLDQNDSLFLMYSSTRSAWIQIGGSNN